MKIISKKQVPLGTLSEKIKRNAEIIALRKKGVSFCKLATTFGVSHQRIQQIVRIPERKRFFFRLQCEACGWETEGYRKRQFCMPCYLKDKDVRKTKKDMLADIFKDVPEWKKQGRERVRFLTRHRDKFTCQDCGKKWNVGERQFDVHHLGGMCGKNSRGYDSIEDMNTLITLCHKCHFNHAGHTLMTN